MKMKSSVVAICAALALAGCDKSAHTRAKSERAESAYREAMADYSAGRLDAAEKGFAATVKSNPANVSARFLLACLLQDRCRDWEGAFCQFREFLFLAPDSDKAAIARERMEICEREFTAALVAKTPAAKTAAAALQEAEARRAALDKEKAAAEKELAAAGKSMAALETEIAGLRKMVASIADEADGKSRPDGISKAAEPAETPDEKAKPSGILKTGGVAESAGGQVTSGTIAIPDDVLKLTDGDDSARPAPPAAVPAGKPAAGTAGKPVETAKPATDGNKPKRPAFYIVEEGDTLYKIAIRFYGRRSAWSKIRDANKAVVSTDGRIKAGQKLVLPEGD